MLEYLLLSEGNWKRVYLMLWNPSLLLTQISWLRVLEWLLSIRVKISDTKPFRNSKYFVKYNFLYIILITMWLLLLTLLLHMVLWPHPSLKNNLGTGGFFLFGGRRTLSVILVSWPCCKPKETGFHVFSQEFGKKEDGILHFGAN